MPTSTQDPPTPREVGRLLREEFSPYTAILTVLLGVLAVVGSIASLHDGEGERLAGYLPFAGPAVVATWTNLELLLRRTALPLGTRLFFACVIAPLPSVLISTIAWSAAGLSPAGQEVIARESVGLYDHYWWPQDARGAGVIALMLFGSFGVGAAIGLFTLLILVLPLKALLHTDEVLEGTDLDPAHAAGNSVAVMLACAALSAGTIAAILGVLGISAIVVALMAALTVALLIGAAVLARRR